MRLWSIHPQYFDPKGFILLWQEALLAKRVLEDEIPGYRFHPQLMRFRSTKNPLDSINTYLKFIYEEAQNRGFKLNGKNLSDNYTEFKISVTKAQINFEFNYLLKKLKTRDRIFYEDIRMEKYIMVHPFFELVDDRIKGWVRA